MIVLNEKIIRSLKEKHGVNYDEKIIRIELLKYCDANKADDLLSKWSAFLNKLYSIEKNCLLGLKQVWYKLPVIFRDCCFFKNKLVIDVGGMCGLTSFWISELGCARRVVMLDAGVNFCRCLSTACQEISVKNIEARTGRFENFFNPKNLKEDVSDASFEKCLYMSDILYQIEKDIKVLELVKNSLSLFDLVVVHSRENNTKPRHPRRGEGHKNKLGFYKNIYSYLNTGECKVYYPWHTSDFLKNIRSDIEYPSRIEFEYASKTYITVIREKF
jgi:hypothetical protein